MTYLPTDFLGVPEEASDYQRSRVVVLPVPFERTTSYGKGTAQGPEAILRASRQVELRDEQLGSEPWRMGIATLPAFLPRAHDLEEALGELQAEAHRHLAAGKFLLTLGGEHSLTTAPVRAARAVHGEIGVVQFDAHADLRDGIPKTLEIDTFDGDAWIGIVPFRMSNVGLRALPGLPGATAFPELNVRTYVRRDDRPGVWFFSLDAASAMAVRLARTFFRLPYFDAEMHVRTDANTHTVELVLHRRGDGHGH